LKIIPLPAKSINLRDTLINRQMQHEDKIWDVAGPIKDFGDSSELWIRCLHHKKLPPGLYHKNETDPEETWVKEKELRKLFSEIDWELPD